MLEGYKPIDFSSVFPPMDLGQMRNRVGVSQAAIDILANSRWNKTPISSLKAAGFNSKGEAPKRQQTLWGRFVDLLSTPAYAIANATDDAIAGHQSSDTDSVLSDAGQIIGGIVTGGGRGIGTGLRGAFTSSETAANPQDKIYLGDALIRLDTHMSAEDAMKPENREKVRERLMGKKINRFSDDDKDKYFYDFDKGVVEVTDEDIDQYFEDMNLYGLGASMVGDPLNFLKGPANILSGTKGLAEIPEVTNIAKSADKLSPLNSGTPKVNLGSMAVGKTSGSYKVIMPPGSIQNRIANPATGELITPPSWFEFPSSPELDELGDVLRSIRDVKESPPVNIIDPLDNLLNSWTPGKTTQAERQFKGSEVQLPVAKIDPGQLRLADKLSSPEGTAKLTKDLVSRAAVGDLNWADNLRSRLAIKYPGISFNQTNKLIDRISSIPNFSRRLGIPAENKKIIGAFNRTIRADAEALKIPPKVKSAEVIINEISQSNPINLERLVQNSKPREIQSKNPTRDSKIADETIKKFKDQILGKARPAGIRNPGAYDYAVASGKTARYSGSQQVQMWNHITHVLKDVKSPNRFAVANNILRKVEDSFMAKGAIPVNGVRVSESTPLRLSQVLDSIGPAAAAISPTLLTKILRGESKALETLPIEVIQKIEELKAGEALVDSGKVIEGVNAASKQIEDITKGPLSVARTEEVVTIGSKVASDITASAGGSSVAQSKAANYLKDEFIPKTPIDTAINSSHLNTSTLISHPDVSNKLLKKYSNAPAITRAINKTIGGPSPRILGTKVGESARALEWLGARFNAAYKNADMRPIYLKNIASAKATVARRADYLNKLAKEFNINDSALWDDALKGAQGRLAPIEGSQAALLSREILQVMENLFGSSGLNNAVALENSVAGRSQLFMKELNSNLKRFGLGQYQFTKKGDYSKGTQWLNSWESWKIERPLDFLFKIQNVVEHTVREKTMFDEIISRFGSYTRNGDFVHTVNSHPRLAGIYFGKEASNQIIQFIKNLKEISKPSSKALQNFDKVLSKWKSGVTIYVPSHHIRNMIGDLYFNWLGGVNSARPYSAALKVMQSQRGRYEGIAELNNLTSPNALKRAIEGKYPNSVGKQTALTMRNGTHVTNDMVYVSAFQQGILPTTRVLEDIPDDVATGLEKIRPLGGRGQKAAHKLSEGRDHYIRLAHFIDALKKSNKPFENAVEDAAAIVRKWHPDGMDLTTFERNVMRRMFPFYSWTRKAFPLIVESVVATPGKVMAYPKGQYLLQNMMGIESGPMSDPFPYDQLFPDWLREKGIGPITGEPGSYTVVNPGNPTMDLISQMSDPGKMGMSMLNPAARIPIELATGREAQTGAPIDGITDIDYLAKQIPGVSHAGRITGEFGVSDTTKENSTGYNMQNILNLLTALGIQNTGPYQKSAEFDLREYLRSQK
ncbi:hypothetical protein [Streptomyces hebeiensis]